MVNIRENITLFLKVLERYNLSSIKYIHYVGNQDCNSAGKSKSLSLVESVGYFYYLIFLKFGNEYILLSEWNILCMSMHMYVCIYTHIQIQIYIYNS